MEVFCELQTACDLEYITSDQFNSLRPQIIDIAKMLSGLRTAFQARINKAPTTSKSFNNQ